MIEKFKLGLFFFLAGIVMSVPSLAMLKNDTQESTTLGRPNSARPSTLDALTEEVLSPSSSSSLKATVFITGANRGLGLELVKQYAEDGWKVYASCRTPQEENSLQELVNKYPNIITQQLDVSSEQEIDSLTTSVKDVPIDVLINNAGVLGDSLSLDKLTKKELLDVFSVNSFAPLLVSRALLPNLKQGRIKTIVAISSSLGCVSTNDCVEWNYYAYKASKAALNMLMTSFILEPAHSDIHVLLIHPGSVKTAMGGKDAEIEPQESVLGIRTLVKDAAKIPKGYFIDYLGNKMPW
jgi:NAD(P)-dependent dehydrogenase (short-subunit alcohol dehydrogenase family)